MSRDDSQHESQGAESPGIECASTSQPGETLAPERALNNDAGIATMSAFVDEFDALDIGTTGPAFRFDPSWDNS